MISPEPNELMNEAAAGFHSISSLPEGLRDFLCPLDRSFTPFRAALVHKRVTVLRQRMLPDYIFLHPR
jgi:hypothetical protein